MADTSGRSGGMRMFGGAAKVSPSPPPGVTVKDTPLSTKAPEVKNAPSGGAFDKRRIQLQSLINRRINKIRMDGGGLATRIQYLGWESVLAFLFTVIVGGFLFGGGFYLIVHGSGDALTEIIVLGVVAMVMGAVVMVTGLAHLVATCHTQYRENREKPRVADVTADDEPQKKDKSKENIPGDLDSMQSPYLFPLDDNHRDRRPSVADVYGNDSVSRLHFRASSTQETPPPISLPSDYAHSYIVDSILGGQKDFQSHAIISAALAKSAASATVAIHPDDPEAISGARESTVDDIATISKAAAADTSVLTQRTSATIIEWSRESTEIEQYRGAQEEYPINSPQGSQVFPVDDSLPVIITPAVPGTYSETGVQQLTDKPPVHPASSNAQINDSGKNTSVKRTRVSSASSRKSDSVQAMDV